MSWLVFAFSGPVLWAASTHLDKYLVERYVRHGDVAVLLLFTAFVGLPALPFIVFWEPTLVAAGAGSVALIVLAGILYMAALLLYLRALQSEEASVVSPFFQSAPLFGYVLAYLVLGETLSGRQMAGGAMIIVGTVIVSIRFAPALASGASGGAEDAGFKLRLALLMLAFGLAAALSGLIFKFFALRLAFWTVMFWMLIGQAIFGGALMLFTSYRRQLAAILRAHAAAFLAIGGSNELINLGGSLAFRYALIFAPLSIMQAIGGTTTLFVFAFGVALSMLFPHLARESLSARELAQKAVAALLTAAGVILVTR